MAGRDVFLVFEVGNGASHLEEAVIGAGTQSQVAHCFAKKAFPGAIEFALLLDVFGPHEGDGINAFIRVALDLTVSRGDHALTDCC